MRLAALIPLCFPALAWAEAVEIPGPAGPLGAEMIAVAGAAHAVVIIPGSGPIDRDGNAPAMGLHTDTYRLLAEGLAEAGIASLRIDKRGFFLSAAAVADPNDVTISGYAEDARAWVARAAGLAPCVWIAGHSEGGLVAQVAAEAPPEALCGLILLAASGRPVGQVLLEQVRANPANAPLLAEIEGLVADLEAGHARDPATISAALRPMFSEGLQRYMTDLFSWDPAALTGWGGPVLIVQGDADLQVRTLDAELLAAALPQAEVVVLAGATHLLKPDVPGQPLATYTGPAQPLHPGLVPAIAGFLARHDP